MFNSDKELEIFWDKLLSRDHLQIHEVFDPLDVLLRNQIIAHLQRMATEEGWQEEQKESALAALNAIETL